VCESRRTVIEMGWVVDSYLTGVYQNGASVSRVSELDLCRASYDSDSDFLRPFCPPVHGDFEPATLGPIVTIAVHQ
jgi:hypothetical protein